MVLVLHHDVFLENHATVEMRNITHQCTRNSIEQTLRRCFFSNSNEKEFLFIVCLLVSLFVLHDTYAGIRSC